MTTTQMIETFSEDKLGDRTKLNNSKVKGKVLLHTVEFVKHEFKNKGFEKLISKLDIGLQIALRKNIDPNEWFPIANLIDLTTCVISMFFNNDKSKISLIGNYAGNKLTSGFTGFKIKLYSIEKLADFLKLTLETYFLSAKISVKSVDSKHLVLDCSNLFDPSNSLLYRFVGIVEAVLSYKGLKGLQVSFIKDEINADSFSIQAIWSN